jgi:tRNA A-37 threonylcarbamoyl transferase component Bud32
VIRREKDGVRWELRDEFSALLESVLNSAGQIIKESPAKLVTAHAFAERIFFVKRYRSEASPLRSFKFFFKKSQARKEWKLSQQLESLRIPIVHHLALGERWTITGLHQSILITEGFPGKALNETTGVPSDQVLKFVEAMYAKGVVHSDLHPGNILIHQQTHEMRLVDLHGVRIQADVSQAERDTNLAFLNIFFPLPLSRDVLRLSGQLRKAHYARRAKRCLKANREFTRRIFGPFLWHVRIPYLNSDLEKVLANPDNFFEVRAEIFKRGRSATVGCAKGIVVKRFHLRKLSRLPVDLFRPSRARRAYRKAYHLELVGVPTARPIATADKRIARFLFRSYFVMEEIRGAVDLSQWRGEVPRAVHAAAGLLAKLHEEGFSHRDLKETNLVFDRENTLHLLDLEGLRFLGTVLPGRAVLDLVRLNRAAIEQLPYVSKADRKNFLRAYCKVRGVRPRELFSRHHSS